MKKINFILALLFLLAGLPSAACAKNVVLRPPLPTNRVAIFFHGSGGYAENLRNNPGVISTVEILLRRGFAVAASDAYGPQNWGSPASIAANVHLIRRLGYKRVFFFGGSMGGLDEFQLIKRIHPEAVAALSPVCDVSAVPLIGIAMQTWDNAPPDNLTPVVPHPDSGLPVKIWASPEDTWVPKARNADVCARELRRRGARVTQVMTSGEHTNPNMATPRSVPDFFSTVARRIHLATSS